MFGRTWREVSLLGIGLYFCLQELLGSHFAPQNFAMYALATGLFSLRFFAARGLGVGVALGAIAQRWPALRWTAHTETIDWIWFAPFVVLALLCSRDLEEKFERAPSRFSWLPNFWQHLPSQDLRPLRWCMYSLGTLAALLVQVTMLTGTESMHWALATTVCLGALLFLLVLGRAAALLLVPVVTGVVLYQSVPQFFRAEELLHSRWLQPVGPLGYGAPYVLPIVVTATAGFLLSSWFSARLLVRVARTQPAE